MSSGSSIIRRSRASIRDAVGYKPTNVAFAPDGGFYVGDGYGSHYIHQYDKDAHWVRTWGGLGTTPGKMNTPHGLWLDDRPGRTPSLVVADRANARLQYFTLDGKHISFVNDVLFPAHFDIRGDVLLVPDLHARVSLFDRDNKVDRPSGRRRGLDRGSEEDADSHTIRSAGWRANSSIRTTPASTTTEISSSSNGSTPAA